MFTKRLGVGDPCPHPAYEKYADYSPFFQPRHDQYEYTCCKVTTSGGLKEEGLVVGGIWDAI